MGWGDCGTDSRGRRIGYSFSATCDHPGCDAHIDRGLSYACGGMHGEEPVEIHADGTFWTSCEGYFCPDHLKTWFWETRDAEGEGTDVCPACYAELERVEAEHRARLDKSGPDE